MARRLRAFVSYRRQDEFMQGPNSGAFIEQLQRALRHLGFSDIFIDTADIKAGDHFEGRIHRAIADCDLFVELIGRNWIALLREKIDAGERDILVRELHAAFRLEKEIVPLLVGGAAMQTERDLPEEIKELARLDAKAVASTSTVDAIVAALDVPAGEASHVRKLGREWTVGYIALALLAYVICAIIPHIVGLREFGFHPWLGMVKAWSGFFIWPIIFLPFILLGLYRPFKILLEATLNSVSVRDGLTYCSPLTLGTLVAVAAVVVEVSPPEVPWTVHPRLQSECHGNDAPPRAGPMSSYDKDRAVLASYGVSSLQGQYGQQFWMKGKCWPNVFFYLTVPLYQFAPDQDYKTERTAIQSAFIRVLDGPDSPRSTLFPFYVTSFLVLIWLCAVAIIMSVIYAVVNIRRPRDDRILRVPSEDAFLCLSYAFVTLMLWVPFRMSTTNIKSLYACSDLTRWCGPGWETYVKDGALGLTLFLAYSALTVGMLWNHRRLLLGFLATIAVTLVAGCAAAVLAFPEAVARVTDIWQFWVAAAIPISIMLLALWYQFDPAIVRFNDFRRDID